MEEPNVEEVPEGQFGDYALHLAEGLCMGNEAVLNTVMDFMNQAEQSAGASEFGVQSEFAPFDVGEQEPLTIDVMVRKVEGGFQVTYSATGGFTSEADGSAEKNLPGRPASGADAEAVQALLGDGKLAKEYASAAEAQGLKVNLLVQKSLVEAGESGAGLIRVEAPGNQPLVFSSRLGDADMLLFGQVFASSVAYIARLDLAYNLLTDVGAANLAEGLLGPQASRLESLSLRGNAIGPRGCDALTKALRHCPTLRRFDIAMNPLGRPGGLMVIQLVQELPELLELYMSDTQADIDVLVAMAAVLLTGGPQLKVADLEKPMIKTLQEEHTVHIGRMLRVNVHLTEIYLGKHRMRDEGVRQLVSLLLENKTLRVLDLRCNELGADGASHLATLLSSDCQLRRLNLEGNRIGEKDNVSGSQAFAEALLNNRMLTHLNLNNNSLCGQALQVLGDAMDQNATVQTVELFHNNWDQPSSYKFHQIFNDRARLQPLRADFVTSAVDLRIDVCQIQGFKP